MEPDIGGQRVEGDQQNPALLGDKAWMADGLAIFLAIRIIWTILSARGKNKIQP